jgi:hypothetical protein
VAELYPARRYPTRPFVTVRPPLLAWIEAMVGDAAMPWLGAAGTLAAAGLWVWRLRAEAFAVRLVGAGAVLAAGLPLSFSPFVFVHDFWSGLAISCALACPGPRSRASLGLLAACFRELSLPFLWVLLAFEKDRRPALLATGAAVALLTVHALSIHAGGLHSQGWFALRGPVAAVGDMVDLTVLQFIPRLAALVLCALPLVGWLRDRIALAWFAGFWAVVAVLARTDNPNWVLNLLPAWFVGYALILQKVAGAGMWYWRASRPAKEAASGSAASPRRPFPGGGFPRWR